MCLKDGKPINPQGSCSQNDHTTNSEESPSTSVHNQQSNHMNDDSTCSTATTNDAKRKNSNRHNFSQKHSSVSTHSTRPRRRVILKYLKSGTRIVSLQSLCTNFLLADLRNRLYGWRFFDEQSPEMIHFCKLYRKRVPPHVRRLLQVELLKDHTISGYSAMRQLQVILDSESCTWLKVRSIPCFYSTQFIKMLLDLKNITVLELDLLNWKLNELQHSLLCTSLSNLQSLSVLSLKENGSDDIIGVVVKCCPKMRELDLFNSTNKVTPLGLYYLLGLVPPPPELPSTGLAVQNGKGWAQWIQNWKAKTDHPDSSDTLVQIHREFSELLHQWTVSARDQDSEPSNSDDSNDDENSKHSTKGRLVKPGVTNANLRPVFKLTYLKYLDLRITSIPNEYLELLKDVLKNRTVVRYVGDVKLCY